MEELIKVTVDESGKQLVSAKELYIGLGLNTTHWKRWYKNNIINNEFFSENVDWSRFALMANGNECSDFAISIVMAKHLAIMSRTPLAHKYRDYFIHCEEMARQLFVDEYQKILNDLYDKIYPLDVAIELLNEMKATENSLDENIITELFINEKWMNKDHQVSKKGYTHCYLIEVNNTLYLSKKAIDKINNIYNKRNRDICYFNTKYKHIGLKEARVSELK